ncbi:MAG: AraC family transcriptional regulator [Alteromonadaceae bacterium]|uniref:helix-turn-helix transcriptional regulator n=1 Tax=unclassified Marinobacter TaxID=83889 RepID=UPI000C38FDFE|nr:AraC family transcriptional regulator [Marinobacter sp. BGYM27]MAA66516.1 AraC family transcriptional regulator [Alteromonadaceae bacterium]MBH86008.1 AraC family transcriptional regulator [Alteromonadaceae bacterium]MDG5498798.1 AraC family transcriptional regulator [Marinobacter sp. BGYM27]|tara:strand:- start:2508 stop:3296 length:789 start_codon:yes stop_codon:yes gene_type:complete
MLNAKVVKLPENAHQHEHEHHQVVIGLQGHSGLAGDGWGVDLGTRRACLVPTATRHDFFGNDANHVLVIDLDARAPALSNPLHSEYDRLAPLFDRPLHLDMDERLQCLIHLCASELNQAPDNLSLHNHFAAGIMHCLSSRLVGDQASRKKRHCFNVETIRHYVRKNLHRKITIRELAAESCLSVSRFHEIFREMTGISPHQYIIQARLERATDLMVQSRSSLADISFRTGFSSQGALTNAMKKHRGVTPSALRKRDSQSVMV